MAEERSIPFLRNKYWILRHGKSVPNENGIIISSLENGILSEYALAPEGVNQAQSAGKKFLKELEAKNNLKEDVRICYSPFSRTTQTAEIAAKAIGVPFPGVQCKVMNELRERYFGPSFELFSHDKYAEIWALDEVNPFIPPEGGESVADVVSRLVAALSAIETEFQGCTILLVSHGDPLQILQTIIHALNDDANLRDIRLESRIRSVSVPNILSQHRKFALLTGELRQLA